MFTSVLVANRGEIAVRIIKTLRRLGIRSVVVASIPDRQSLAVRLADESVLLDGYSAAETYLDIDAVIDAAKSHQCQAVHPGYGFLSERADFATRCAANGIVFIGPPPTVLSGVGDKARARQFATENNVPVVPGWDGADDDETLLKEAGRVGAPLMVKARGGGGGRGMREVLDLAALPEALASARREAESAFGDPGLLLERLVTNAHHVEVQVLADAHGNVIHLGERDCSVQRRHQKLIEETPSPVVDDELRTELTSAAVRLARAVGYVNAGTFEFLVGEPPAAGGQRPYYFLEVNPRLQVEHPVTEMVTGVDLVELQLQVAAGEALPLAQEDVHFEGHAMEFRINAEDPRDGFRPSIGRVPGELWIYDGRLDAGFEAGDAVPSQYDSLLAKAIFHGSSREEVRRGAHKELRGLSWPRMRTNAALHLAILESEAFRAGAASVDWLEREQCSLLDAIETRPEWWAAAAVRYTLPSMAAGAVVAQKHMNWIGPELPGCWLDDGSRRRYVRVAASNHHQGVAHVDDVEVAYRVAGDMVIAGGRSLGVRRSREGAVCVWDTAAGDGADERTLFVVPPPPLPRQARTAAAGITGITAPLSGTIVDVRVAEGDAVELGQVLLLLEAMKMEHRVVAPNAGVVTRLNVKARDVVGEGDALVELE